MEHDPRKIIIRGIGVAFFLFIIIFGYSRFGRYINGPQITEISIKEYQTAKNLNFTISGTVKDTEVIQINGRMITLNDKNKFEEIVALSPGTNSVIIDLEDPFGSTQHYEYNIYSTANEVLYKTTYNEAQESLLELEEESLEPINE